MSIEEVDDAIEIKQVQTRLKMVQQALDEDNLEEAQEKLTRALEVPGEHPERAEQIRDMLKAYSDRISTQTTPEWAKAHSALNHLDVLGLQNDDTCLWQRELSFEQARFLLNEKELDASFEIFKNLLNDQTPPSDLDEINVTISNIVRENITQLAEESQLELMSNVINRVQQLMPADDELSRWLKTISLAVEKASAKYQEQIEALNQSSSEYQNKLKKREMLNYILAALLVVAIIAFIVALAN